VPQLAAIMRGRTTRSWIESLESVGVPCGPINKFADVESNEQVMDRNVIKTMGHPEAGEMRSVASPMRFSRSLVEDEKAPPLLGVDTQDVLREYLGASDEEIAAWRSAGII
jgi:crotonobetainyl-CoA:carnitine CoA-transferase CaiB-like acyl-CoA transferase